MNYQSLKLAVLTAGVFALALAAAPVLASEQDSNHDNYGQHHGSEETSNDVVINDNSAFASNHVSAEADTGDNWAGGSYGGDGGDGGKIISKGEEVEDSTTGEGGTGGDAGTGGTIYTGDAKAEAGVLNLVNTNRTDIDRCACAEDEDADEANDKVVSRNRAIIMNDVEAEAETGENSADGSMGGDGGNGGTIVSGDDEGEVDDSSTGMGAGGGMGGDGGLIQTGHAESSSRVINVVNRNITRIMR